MSPIGFPNPHHPATNHLAWVDEFRDYAGHLHMTEDRSKPGAGLTAHSWQMAYVHLYWRGLSE